MNQPIVEDLVTASYILANEGVLDGLGHISGSGKRSDWVEREEIRTPERSERIQRSREMLCSLRGAMGR